MTHSGCLDFIWSAWFMDFPSIAQGQTFILVACLQALAWFHPIDLSPRAKGLHS